MVRSALLSLRKELPSAWYPEGEDTRTVNDLPTSTAGGPTTRLSVIEGCRQGDNQAWTTFFSIYGPIIYRYGRHAGLSDHEAEEVVAKVMGSLMQALRRGFAVDHATGRFRHYLRSTANHEISAQRRRRRPNHADLGDVPEPSSDELLPEEHWCDLERQERLRICLDQLHRIPQVSPRDLLAFHRYALRNEPADNVAKDCGISKSRLYVIKHEIIQHLRRLRVELDGILGEV